MADGDVIYRIRGDNSKLPDDLKEAENIIGKSAEKAEKAAKTAIKAIGAAASAAAAAGAAIGTAAVNSADSLDKAVKHITAATGAGADAAEKYSEVIKGVYGDNFGESFEGIAADISTITQNLGEMDEEQLKKVTESAYALQDAFDMDVAESSRAAKAMQENFGIAADKAYDYIAKGAQDGLNYSGELLDNISEYSVQFKKLGFDADDMFTIFERGAENGAWNLDKIGDAVKEFSIRAIDGSDTTKKGFEALGYDAEDMAKKFAQGGDTARAAFQTVIKALGDMEDPIAQNEAGVNLFGTMWEDLGADAVKALGEITDSAYDCAGTVDDIVEVSYSSLSDALSGLKRKAELLIQPLGEELIPVIETAVEKLGDIAENVIPVLLDATGPLVEALLDLVEPISTIISELLPPLIEFAADIAAKISDFVGRHLPALISALKNAMNFFGNIIKVAWEMRDVIAAIVAALITFNTVIKIGNAVSGAVNAIRAFKTITDAATASQVALNVAGAANPFVLIASLASGAIGALVAFNNTTETAAEKVDRLHEEAMQLNQTAKDSANAAQDLSKLTDEYKNLKNSSDDVETVRKRLEELQQSLIDSYGTEAAKIDLVNGKYEEQLVLLGKLIDDKNTLAESSAKAAYYSAQDAQKEEWALSLSNTSGNLHTYLNKWFTDEAGSNYEGITSGFGSATTNYTFKEGTTYKERYDAISAMIKRMEKYIGTDSFDSSIYSQLVTAQQDMYEKWQDYEKIVSNFENLSKPKLSGKVLGSKSQAEYYKNLYGGNADEKQEEPSADEVTPATTYKPYTPTADTTAKSSKSTTSGGSGSGGSTISITSYVPTIWDNDQTAALKSLIGKDVLGKTATAHQINSLTGVLGQQTAAKSGETTLADVVNAITKLHHKVEKMDDAIGDVTIVLKARDLTIGKAAVRDINDMAKQSGKSPFTF